MKIITDKRTNLEWSKTAPMPVSWERAKVWCEGLGEGWRVPTVQELQSLVDCTQYNPAVPAEFKDTTASSGYWSATTIAGIPGSAWLVDFGGGDVDGDNKDFVNCVRAVRAGSVEQANKVV